MTRTVMIRAASALAALLLFAGCAEEPDMEGVVSDFIAGINAQDIDAVRSCLDAKAGKYGEGMDFWTDGTRFGTATDHAIGAFTELKGTTARADFSSATGGARTFYFRMRDGGNRFYIRHIDNDADLMSPFFQ